MFRWVFLLSLALGAAALGVVVIRNLPTLQRDIQRYIDMRTM